MSKIAERLARLLALADLEEGADDARQNEARNAAMELLRTVKKHKVKIKFQIPSEPAEKTAREDLWDRIAPKPDVPYWKSAPRSGTQSNDARTHPGVNFNDILRDFAASGFPHPRASSVLRAWQDMECWRCKRTIKKGDRVRVEGGKQPCHTDCQP